MNPKLLNILICPECDSTLKIEEYDVEGPELKDREILEGSLTCDGCFRDYPIINGIPRMLPDSLFDRLYHYHSDYFSRYGLRARRFTKNQREYDDKKRTLDSFSFQWNTFGEIYNNYEKDFLDYIKPIGADFFRGKLGLDGGCGFGRHLCFAAKYGAEMVGLDLSEAVEAAYRNNKELKNVHIVQGDIYKPPFRENTFDFCYSIGVLHHLPDPPSGFRSLARFVKPGGVMFAWIYGPRQGVSESVTVFLRKFTTRMNYKALYVLCLLIALSLRIFSHYPYMLLSKFNSTKGITEKLPFKYYHNYPFKAVIGDTFDRLSVPLVYYYSGDEVNSWFKNSGFRDINIIRRYRHNESWRALGVKT
jgi:SAM-dependent methyltransferase